MRVVLGEEANDLVVAVFAESLVFGEQVAERGAKSFHGRVEHQVDGALAFVACFVEDRRQNVIAHFEDALTKEIGLAAKGLYEWHV